MTCNLDHQAIRAMLPHRYPFLMVDRVISVAPNVSIEAVKNVSHNEPFFQGHFPEQPVMPGVMMIEAMAQAAGLLALSSGGSDRLFLLSGVDRARFRRRVVPGDVLVMHLALLKVKRTLWCFHGEAHVDDQLVCAADLMLTEVPA